MTIFFTWSSAALDTSRLKLVGFFPFHPMTFNL
ncbi:hypothetical protein J466_3856, partial [Acinetobacter baumannii 1046674]